MSWTCIGPKYTPLSHAPGKTLEGAILYVFSYEPALGRDSNLPPIRHRSDALRLNVKNVYKHVKNQCLTF